MNPTPPPNATGLTPERLHLLMAGFAGMAPEEVRKAKLLFIRNELSELRAIIKNNSSMGVVQGCFAIIPIFWPVLWAQRSGMKTTVTMRAEQIRNALSVWRDDLGEDAARLEAELAALAVPGNRGA